MGERKTAGGLSIDETLYRLVDEEITPGTGVTSEQVWTGLASILESFGPRNQALLEKRNTIQAQLDQWHSAHAETFELAEYKSFLKEIGYLVESGPEFEISTSDVDEEIATVAGPQLVVPVDNARYALNAANARWGSLYDALYGTDVIDEANGADKSGGYNPVRGARVVQYAAEFLDSSVPLVHGSHVTAASYSLDDRGELLVVDQGGAESGLRDPSKFLGFNAADGILTSVLLINNGLHIEIQIDSEHPIGKSHSAGVKDVVLESAITAIQDCEDSVAAVDAADKVTVYRNWTGLMKGDLTTSFQKGKQTVERRLNANRVFQAKQGGEIVLPGRAVLLVRNVGMHLTTDAVLDSEGAPIAETLLDALITSLAAMHDLSKDGNTEQNSRAGSVYIVKPKMHGPEEVALAVEVFAKVEKVLGLKENTLKIGIMDEERRTTVNLAECIRAAQERVIFINTGFLDRTGDEIHTAMTLGPMIPKPEMKNAKWITAYEDWNVDVGIRCGLPGRAQIGKGMWAMPEAMADMVANKIGHLEAGANTAWVPSPTAATLHAMHYHQVNVRSVQEDLRKRAPASLDDILTIPVLAPGRTLEASEIQHELDNNAQGILGYVVRWIDQGVGCSKVPDINNIDLMEDRATLRISSQYIANWLHHKLTTRDQVLETFKKMALVVDEQNKGDPNYLPMAPDYDGVAFQAALDMVFKGVEEPNGYTEPTLTARRRELKGQQ